MKQEPPQAELARRPTVLQDCGLFLNISWSKCPVVGQGWAEIDLLNSQICLGFSQLCIPFCTAWLDYETIKKSRTSDLQKRRTNVAICHSSLPAWTASGKMGQVKSVNGLAHTLSPFGRKMWVYSTDRTVQRSGRALKLTFLGFACINLLIWTLSWLNRL